MPAGDQGRVEIPGSRRLPLRGSRQVAEVPASRHSSVTLVLRRPSGFDFLNSGDLARRPTRREWSARCSAAKEDVGQVRELGESAGFRVDRPAAGRLLRFEGTTRELARAFGATVAEYAAPTARYVGRDGPLTIPRPLEGVVTAVFGLDERPASHPHFRRSSQASVAGYRPADVATAYGFPAGTDGRGRCVGLLEFGGGFDPGDLTAYFAGVGQPSPSVTAVGVSGGANAPTGDPNGPDGEVDLDIEVVGGAAPGAQVAVYFAPNSEQGFVDALSAATHDVTHSPTGISISWGGPEESWTAQARATLTELAQEAGAGGITVLAASGDQGADDGGPGTGLAVDFPASSPAILGCGGTRLTLQGAQIVDETVWNDLAQNEGATGGGVSAEFAEPSYQAGRPVPSAPAPTGGRGVPDVAASADPQAGYVVRVDGQELVLGGTSASAPLWAALIVRLEQALGRSIGLAHPSLYAAPSGAFRTILVGNNGGYNAGPGWDPCTGLGSPVGANLLAALSGTSSSA